MKYYKLMPTTQAWQRRVQSDPVEAIKQIKIDSRIDIELNLKLVFEDLSAEGGVKYNDHGFSFWHDWSGPKAYVWTVSEEFHSILEKFKHDQLDIIPVQLKKREEVRQYYLYHLLGHPMANLAFNKITFQVTVNDQAVKSLQMGEVLTFEDYRQKLVEVRKENPRAKLKSSEWVYDREYDIVWGNPFVILLSEKVVSSIKKNLKYEVHFSLEDFKEYKITT